MNFTYNKSNLIGESLTKYGIVFKAGISVEVEDDEIIKKLVKSPYFDFSNSEVKPKRKYNKKPKGEKNEAQNKPQAEAKAKAAPEAEINEAK